jgi:hypothetical protein
MKTSNYHRRFTVDESQVDLAIGITSPHQPADIDSLITELAGELGAKIFKRLWHRSEMAEALERLENSGRPRQAREFRQLADLAWQRKGLCKWRPIELADLAVEVGLLHDLLLGHRPGQRLGRKHGAAFGRALAGSCCFKVSGRGHQRTYTVIRDEPDHANYHSTHHEQTQPAPFSSVRKN